MPERTERPLGWTDGLPTPTEAGGRAGEQPSRPSEDPLYSTGLPGSRPPASHDPRANAPEPPERSGSGSYESLAPLPADDRARPPSTAGTGDRPFLPPDREGQPALVEHGLGRPALGPARVVDEDSEPTSPLPVILPGAASIPRPAQIETPRGPFEPARPTRPTSITGSVEPPPPLQSGAPHGAGPLETTAPAEPGRSAVGTGAAPPDDLSQPVDGSTGQLNPGAASAELEQIKDLYLTAEAIGEEALDKHFEQVSQRQRELIKEFFDRSSPADGDAP
jgi:hypothetical protein